MHISHEPFSLQHTVALRAGVDLRQKRERVGPFRPRHLRVRIRLPTATIPSFLALSEKLTDR
jgi:hypothetical protein